MSTTTGRDWLTMTPGHFDAGLLPKGHRKPETAGLFSVADVAPATTRPVKVPAELEGQAELFPCE
jgi:hypothetical protein